MKTKQTFASFLQEFQYHFDLPLVFDDFLTMSVASFGRNLNTGLSFDEDLYLKTIEKYKTHHLRSNFPKMLAALTTEMTERLASDTGNDIMGEFYEEHLAKKGLSQFFTPYPICKFMAQSAIGEARKSNPEQPFKILDPACGSGRMLVVTAQESGKNHFYFGIDVDLTCVKMTTLNLFLNGVFKAEIMCANALLPDEFRGSYVTSLIPIGIFRIEDREKSLLYRLVNAKEDKNDSGATSKSRSDKEYEWGKGKPLGSQLEFF